MCARLPIQGTVVWRHGAVPFVPVMAARGLCGRPRATCRFVDLRTVQAAAVHGQRHCCVHERTARYQHRVARHGTRAATGAGSNGTAADCAVGLPLRLGLPY